MELKKIYTSQTILKMLNSLLYEEWKYYHKERQIKTKKWLGMVYVQGGEGQLSLKTKCRLRKLNHLDTIKIIFYLSTKPICTTTEHVSVIIGVKSLNAPVNKTDQDTA